MDLELFYPPERLVFGGLLGQILAPFFGSFLAIGKTTPSQTDRNRNSSAPGQPRDRFWRRFGCPTEPFGRLLAKKAVKFGRSGRSSCRSYANHRASGESQVKSEVKVYLTDHSYD